MTELPYLSTMETLEITVGQPRSRELSSAGGGEAEGSSRLNTHVVPEVSSLLALDLIG